MSDLIRKSELMKKIQENCPQICDDKADIYGTGAYSQYLGDINTIINMPTVDSEKNKDWEIAYENLLDDYFKLKDKKQKHGHWTRRKNRDGRYYEECSECGCKIYAFTKGKYCMCCGAKMDEVTE